MPGRQSHGPLIAVKPKISKSHNNHRRKNRSLNAFAIAEKQLPSSLGISRARLSELDQRPPKRQRINDGNDHEDTPGDDQPGKPMRRNGRDGGVEDVEIHSDSEGNEWKTGEVDSEDDSDINSNEAMGESDNERFEGFTFRGSSSGGQMKKTKRATAGSSMQVQLGLGEIDLNEDGSEEDEDTESDGLGDDAIDIADVLDQGSEDEDVEEEIDFADRDDASMQDGSESEPSHSDEDEVDPEKLSSLRRLVADLEGSTGDSATTRRAPSAHESMPPSEFALPTKTKLTVADLLPSVTDPKLRKSLKIISNTSAKPSSKRSGIPGKLEVPLPKRQQDRLDRAAAYGKAKETLNRWVDTVKHNRRAEHLSFPFRDPNESVPQGKDKLLPVVNSRPVNNLETTILSILEESGLASGAAKNEDEDFAELEANKPSFEEVQARRADLRRARDLLFREEQRAKRIKKIKSKAYRKVHRRDRDRQIMQEAEKNGANGIEDSDEERERNDRRRAEERMGQRHRESRWAKGMKHSGRSTWDEDARNGMQEMARRSEELKRRIQGKDVERDDDSSASDDDDNGEDDERDQEAAKTMLVKSLTKIDMEDDDQRRNPHVKSSLNDMEFMRRADAAQKARNDDAIKDLKKTLIGESSSSEEEGETSEGLGRRTYGPGGGPDAQVSKPPHRQNRTEFEEGEASDEEQDDVRLEEERDVDIAAAERGILKDHAPKVNPFSTGQTSISRHHLQNLPASKAIPVAVEPEAPKLRSALKGSRAAEASSSAVQHSKTQHSTAILPSAGSLTTVHQAKTTPSPPSLDFSLESSDGSDVDDGSPKTPLNPPITQKDALTRAFAGDDVQAAFEAEKKALTEEEGPQTEDTTLPGWGRWAGPALSKKDKAFNNRKRFTTTTPGVVDAEKRRDRKLEKVIINERRQKKSGKYLAPQLPHPFETKGQYERSLRIPMGPEWGTKETFQGMTKPRVMLKQGVIKAMKRPMI